MWDTSPVAFPCYQQMHTCRTGLIAQCSSLLCQGGGDGGSPVGNLTYCRAAMPQILLSLTGSVSIASFCASATLLQGWALQIPRLWAWLVCNTVRCPSLFSLHGQWKILSPSCSPAPCAEAGRRACTVLNWDVNSLRKCSAKSL